MSSCPLDVKQRWSDVTFLWWKAANMNRYLRQQSRNTRKYYLLIWAIARSLPIDLNRNGLSLNESLIIAKYHLQSAWKTSRETLLTVSRTVWSRDIARNLWRPSQQPQRGKCRHEFDVRFGLCLGNRLEPTPSGR